jgi:hypothetical protein
MTMFRKRRLARREKLAQQLLWTSSVEAQEHYREILVQLAASEFNTHAHVCVRANTLRAMPAPAYN